MSTESPQLEQNPPRWWASRAWLLLPILAVGAFWRTRWLSEISYWFDESFSLRMAQFPVLEILNRSAQDTLPPGFYLILKVWGLVFGTSPVASRALSITCGLSTIVGTYLFVREAYRPEATDAAPAGDLRRSDWTALTAAALVAFSPLQIEWSLMVRMYAPLATFAVFSAWFLLRALRRPGPRQLDWALFTIVGILLVYMHHFGLFTLLAELIFGCIYVLRKNPAVASPSRTRSLRPLLVSAGAIAAVWTLWLGSFLEQEQRVVANFWSRPIDWDGIGSIFFQLFGVHEWEAAPVFEGLMIAQAAAVVVLLVLVRGRPGDLIVAIAASLPFIAALGFSLVGRNIFFTRYLLAGHLFLLIAAAVLLCRIPLWPFRLAMVAAALAGMSQLSLKHSERRDRLAHLPGMQGAMARFEEARKSGEPLVVCDPMLFTSVVAYSLHRDDCFVATAEYPFFHGTAVLRTEEYFPKLKLNDGSCDVVWTLDANQWHGSNWAVSMPKGWKPVGDWRFPEYYCGELVLRMWERPNNENNGSTGG